MTRPDVYTFVAYIWIYITPNDNSQQCFETKRHNDKLCADSNNLQQALHDLAQGLNI